MVVPTVFVFTCSLKRTDSVNNYSDVQSNSHPLKDKLKCEETFFSRLTRSFALPKHSKASSLLRSVPSDWRSFPMKNPD